MLIDTPFSFVDSVFSHIPDQMFGEHRRALTPTLSQGIKLIEDQEGKS